MIVISALLILTVTVSLIGIRLSPWGGIFWAMNMFYALGLAAAGILTARNSFDGLSALPWQSYQGALESALLFSSLLCATQWLVKRLIRGRWKVVAADAPRIVLGPIAFLGALGASVFLGGSVTYSDYVTGSVSGWWIVLFLSACCIVSVQRGVLPSVLMLTLLAGATIYLIDAAGARFIAVAVVASAFGVMHCNSAKLGSGLRARAVIVVASFLGLATYQYFDYDRVGVFRLPEQNVVEMSALVNLYEPTAVTWEVSSFPVRFVGGLVSLPLAKLGVDLEPGRAELANFVAQDVLRQPDASAHFPATWWADIKFQAYGSQLASLLFLALILQLWPLMTRLHGSLVIYLPLVVITQILLARGAVAYTAALLFLPILVTWGVLWLDGLLQRIVRRS